MQNQIQVDSPIVLLRIKGNHKELASKQPFTHVVSFEPHLNVTTILAKVDDPHNREQRRQIIKKVTKYYADRGAKAYESSFHSKGATIFQLSAN